MAIKPSIGQIINPYQLQDGQDVNPSAVSYPLNVADGVKGGSSALDPLSLDIEGLPTGALATTTELAINNGAVNEKTTLSDLATFLDGRDVYSVADITALNAITGMDTGDVAIVADTFDDTGENIAGSYVYNGTTWILQSWYNVYLNTLLDVNAPSPVAGDILQRDGTAWVNVANAFASLNGTPTEVRYFGNTGVSTSDPLFTRDEVTNHTKAVRDYNSQSTINTATVPVQFLTQNTNGTFNIGDQVETRFGEAQAEVLDVNTFVINEISYTNLVYTGVGLNDLTSIYAGGYTGPYPVSYTVEILQNNVAYSGIGGVNGTLSIGDTITGLTSGATAVIVAIDTYKNILAVDTIVGTFIPSEIVQGNTPSDFISIGGDFSTLADIVLISNTNANSIITTIAPTSQLEGVETSFSSFTGHTIGDTWTFDISPTTTLTIVYLTNIIGTLPISSETRLNNLTTPFQTDDGSILASQFSIGDTIDVIDLSAGFNQVGQIQITQTSGQDFNYTVNSGTIAIGNYLYGPSIDKVGFVYNLTSNIVNKTINTGFRTEPIQFPNVPFIIEGSAIAATDGVDKMAVGVFDLSVSGQSELSAGIVAFYGDSSQSTFTTKKGFANLNLLDSTTNKSLNVNYSGDEFTIQGYNNITDFGLSINGNRLSYKANGTQFTFPTSIGGIGYVVADVNGNGNFTLEPISSLINITPTNGLQTIGSDIGLGGTLIQDTIIQPNVDGAFSFSLGNSNRLSKFNVTALDNINITSLQTATISGISAIIAIDPTGSATIGNISGNSTRIVVNAQTDVIDNYTQNGWNIRDFSGNDIMRVNMPVKQVSIGDPGNQSTGFWSLLDVLNATYNVGVVGSGKNFLSINGLSGTVMLGDPNNIFTGTSLQMDTVAGNYTSIVTNDYIVQDILGNRLIESNLSTKSITIGDVSGSLNNVSQTIDNNINATYSVKGFNFGQGIFADFINKLFVLGDVQNAVGNGNKVKVDDGNQLTTLGDGVNGTFIKINDAAQRIELNTSTGEYRVLTSPPSATTQTEALVRDTVTGILYVKDLSSLYTSNISIKTSNYSVVATDQGNIIHIDNSATGIDITLPDPSTVRVGRPFKFKAVGNSANTVRFLPFASENIDLVAGAYTWANPAGLQALEVYTDGVEWFIS